MGHRRHGSSKKKQPVFKRLKTIQEDESSDPDGRSSNSALRQNKLSDKSSKLKSHSLASLNMAKKENSGNREDEGEQEDQSDYSVSIEMGPDEIDEAPHGDRSKLLNYFIDNKLKELTESIGDF